MEILKEARIARGLTQEQAGRMMGITSSAYSKMETGVNRIAPEYFEQICDVLHIPYAEFMHLFCQIIPSPDCNIDTCNPVIEKKGIKDRMKLLGDKTKYIMLWVSLIVILIYIWIQ